MKKNKVLQTKNRWQIFYYIWFIIVVALLMMALMWSVYLIPVEKIRENAKSSAEMLAGKRKEILDNVYVFGWKVDTCTDSRAINIASFVSKDKFHDSMLCPRLDLGKSEELNLYEMLWNFSKYNEVSTVTTLNGYDNYSIKINFYPRFWHGYLLFLKPLLVFFDLHGIRYINLMFQLGLLFFILYLMYERLGFKHCVAFVTAMCFLNPITSWMCLEYSSVVNMLLLATLWVLLSKNSGERYMFFVIGAVTILFDFFTFPLVTLGIPLIVYLNLYKRDFKDDVRCVIKNSFLWLFGYASMWVSKWVLATLFTDQNVIKDAWLNILRRSYGTSEIEHSVPDMTILHSILANIDIIWNRVSLYILGMFFVLVLTNCAFSLCKLQVRYKLKINPKILILLGVGLMPFVWYSVLVQHSIIHCWLFSHRLLAITIYALLSAFVCSLCEVKDEKR